MLAHSSGFNLEAEKKIVKKASRRYVTRMLLFTSSLQSQQQRAV